MNVYEARHKGRDYCNTEGSAHYKGGGVEPIDLMIAKGVHEGFCIGNMLKYATRFKETRNLNDLKKVSDYAHVLCGVELEKVEEIATGVADTMPTADELEADAETRIVANARIQTYCNKRLSIGKPCHECPLGRIANAEYVGCEQYMRLYPDLALEIMRKVVG